MTGRYGPMPEQWVDGGTPAEALAAFSEGGCPVHLGVLLEPGTVRVFRRGHPAGWCGQCGCWWHAGPDRRTRPPVANVDAMQLADCTIGREVIIGMRFLGVGLGGVTCTVLDTRPAPENPDDNPAYPHGMVQVRLPDGVQWGCREPWIGPEDLGCLDAAMREQILGT